MSLLLNVFIANDIDFQDTPKDENTEAKPAEANKESKQDESVVQADEKKEKVKKKRSFRSFSFLRREKKAKEENKNGDAVKEVKLQVFYLFEINILSLTLF